MVEENSSQATTDEQGKQLSIVEEAAKIRDEIKAENDRREKILAEEQKLQAEKMLGGNSGGHVEAPKLSPEEQKKKAAAEFFKGTELEKAING